MDHCFVKEILNRYETLIFLLKDEFLPIVDEWVNKCTQQIQWDVVQDLKDIQKYLGGRLNKYFTEEIEWIETKKKRLKSKDSQETP